METSRLMLAIDRDHRGAPVRSASATYWDRAEMVSSDDRSLRVDPSSARALDTDTDINSAWLRYAVGGPYGVMMRASLGTLQKRWNLL
jgi:hypothetical protein